MCHCPLSYGSADFQAVVQHLSTGATCARHASTTGPMTRRVHSSLVITINTFSPASNINHSNSRFRGYLSAVPSATPTERFTCACLSLSRSSQPLALPSLTAPDIIALSVIGLIIIKSSSRPPSPTAAGQLQHFYILPHTTTPLQSNKLYGATWHR